MLFNKQELQQPDLGMSSHFGKPRDHGWLIKHGCTFKWKYWICRQIFVSIGLPIQFSVFAINKGGVGYGDW